MKARMCVKHPLVFTSLIFFDFGRAGFSPILSAEESVGMCWNVLGSFGIVPKLSKFLETQYSAQCSLIQLNAAQCSSIQLNTGRGGI